MCQHDPAYRIENESNGGAGCPLCNRERKEKQDSEREFYLAQLAMTHECVDGNWVHMRGDCAL